MLCGRHAGEVARRKLGVSAEWEVFAFERIDGTDATKLRLGVPRVLTKGKNKGRKRWDGEEKVAIVTEGEEAAEFARYEQETGNCGRCLGTKEVFKSWNHITGTEMKPCPRCSTARA